MKTRAVGGFTLMEMMISVSLMAFAGLWVVPWFQKPATIQRMMTATDQQRLLTNATGLLLNDLSEADPNSIAWNQLPPLASAPTNSISFWKLQYDMANPGGTQQVNYQYQFQPNGSGTGSLVRIVSQGPVILSTTVVLSPIDAPGVTAPSFVQAGIADPNNPNYNILIITLQYHPTGFAPVNVVRRITVAM